MNAEHPPTNAPPPAGRRSRWLGEGVMIVFAVLAALAVDEWWEDRENVELAERATEAVVRELRRNREELEPAADAPTLEAFHADIDRAIAQLRTEADRATARDAGPEGEDPSGEDGTGEASGNLGIDWNVGLLSSAAWQTAQVTRATQFMPLEQVIDLAQVYEVQRFFAVQQDALVSRIAMVGARMETDPVPALIEIRGQYGVVVALRDSLRRIYACTLRTLEGPDAPEAADCPAEDAPDEA